MKPVRLAQTAALAATAALLAGAAAAQPSSVTTYEVDAPYEQVRQDVEDAIINHGLVIDYNAKIGDMLARTAEDVGAEKKIYEDAETLQFCSAVLSRDAMAADPANIAYCPYAVFVYQAAGADTVTVGYRKLDEEGSGENMNALSEVNALLDEIAREASGQ